MPTTEFYGNSAELLTLIRRTKQFGGGSAELWTLEVQGGDPDAQMSAAFDPPRLRAPTRRSTTLVDCLLQKVPLSHCLDILQHAGLAELIRCIRDAEVSDPHGERWPRYKIGDDATAAFCVLNNDGERGWQ